MRCVIKLRVISIGCLNCDVESGHDRQVCFSVSLVDAFDLK